MKALILEFVFIAAGCTGGGWEITSTAAVDVGTVIPGEAILPLQGKTHYRLWKPPTKITQVYQGDVLMAQGTDYRLENGGVAIPQGSNIKPVAEDFIRDAQGSVRIRTDYHQWQLRVTYQTTTYQKAAVSDLGKFSSVIFYGVSAARSRLNRTVCIWT